MDTQTEIDTRTLNQLLLLHNLRSADRASADHMRQEMRKGNPLTYQERQNLWAYANRYGVPTLDATRK